MRHVACELKRIPGAPWQATLAMSRPGHPYNEFECTDGEYNNSITKELDDGSDESTAAHKSRGHALARRRKDRRHSMARWSHVKISFDNESVRLESDPQQAAGSVGPLVFSASSSMAGASAFGGPAPTMTASSSMSANAGAIAPASQSTAVPPTIKIIGKEVS